MSSERLKIISAVEGITTMHIASVSTCKVLLSSWNLKSLLITTGISSSTFATLIHVVMIYL